MKISLRFDAGPRFIFSLKEGESDKSRDKEFPKIEVKIGRDPRITFDTYCLGALCLGDESKTLILPILRATRSGLSLRDLVRALQPEDMEEILSMIDRSLELHEGSLTLAPSIESTALVAPVDTLLCKSDDGLDFAGEGTRVERLLNKLGTIWSNYGAWRIYLSSFGTCMPSPATSREVKYN